MFRERATSADRPNAEAAALSRAPLELFFGETFPALGDAAVGGRASERAFRPETLLGFAG